MSSPTPTSPALATGYARVVAPLDFSTRGWKAVTLAKVVAGAFEAPLRLLHVEAGSNPPGSVPQPRQERAPDGGTVDVEVVRADGPGEGILHALGDDASSLVVMSTHGHTAAAELALGSTTEQVLRQTRDAVVVTGPAYDATTREVSRVVLCVAPTVDPPPQLLEDVRLWGRQFHVPIKVLMVTDRPSAIAFDFELIRAQVRRMEPVAESLATEGQEVDLAHLQGGGAVHEIVTYADAQPGTVLAMATHARPPASRFFLGSGAIGVLRRTKCPVLLRRYPTDA